MSGKGAIGIDLGTTNSCVGEIIPHDQGNRTTMDPVNTVFDDAKKQDDDEAKQFLVDMIVNDTIRNSSFMDGLRETKVDAWNEKRKLEKEELKKKREEKKKKREEEQKKKQDKAMGKKNIKK